MSDQTVQKFGLISAAMLLVPTGLSMVQLGNNIGLVVMGFGIGCLLAREIIKKK